MFKQSHKITCKVSTERKSRFVKIITFKSSSKTLITMKSSHKKRTYFSNLQFIRFLPLSHSIIRLWCVQKSYKSVSINLQKKLISYLISNKFIKSLWLYKNYNNNFKNVIKVRKYGVNNFNIQMIYIFQIA